MSELPREHRLRHAGHADDRRAVAVHAVDFGRGLEPRPGHRSVDAAVVQRDAGVPVPRREAARAQARRMYGCVKSTCTTRRSPPSKNVLSRPLRVVDQLVRQHQVAGRVAPAMPPTRSYRQNGVDAALLQRPQVGAIVDPVRRDRVPVAVPREEYHVAAARSGRRQAPTTARRRGADDFPVGDGERRQPGEPAAADDGQHGSCSEAVEAPSARRPSESDAAAAAVPTLLLLRAWLFFVNS